MALAIILAGWSAVACLLLALIGAITVAAIVLAILEVW